MERYLLVMLGGATGCLLRYLTGIAVASRWTGRFPFGTFVVNVLGSFLIGVLMTVLTERALHPNWRLLLITGFLGGYTTFSSFEYETFVAARDADYVIAGVYVAGSVAAGFMALLLGVALARK